MKHNPLISLRSVVSKRVGALVFLSLLLSGGVYIVQRYQNKSVKHDYASLTNHYLSTFADGSWKYVRL